jgi:Ca-activated chloride channel family protein
MNFLTPLAFVTGLMAIPILLMYMLRLRRREVSVSSTFLWSQVLQDNEANTPWQKLRRNLLLLLQLLILALLVLALARPFITVDAISAGQITVLLDASASMNATDTPDGLTRWQAAQAEALRIVDSLPDDNRMTVIRVAEVPQTLAASTHDRSMLRNAIQNADVSQTVADWTSALNLALGSGNLDDFTLVIIGDGGLPPNVGLQGTNVNIRYIPIGTSAENTAISALATATLPNRPAELYAEVTNYGTLESQMTFTLWVDGERFETTNIRIPAGASLPIVSSQLPDSFTTIEARITRRVNSPASDYLPLDDMAYTVAGDSGSRRVLLVTSGNIFIEQAFRSLPNVTAVRTDGTLSLPDGFDLTVLDRVVPQPLPQGNLLFINPQADSAYFSLGATVESPQNPRLVNPTDSRVNFMDVNSLNFLRVQRLNNIAWADVLMTVDDVPILIAGERDGRRIAILPFNPSESDLPLQITWPILMANLTEWFTPSAIVDITQSLIVGQTLMAMPPLEADAVRITAPDGTTQTLVPSNGSVIYGDTHQAGFYTLETLQAGNVLTAHVVAVNGFSPLESRIAPIPPDGLSIAGAQVNDVGANNAGQRELWPSIALAAVVMLLIEWWAYHRRLQSPTLLRPLWRPRWAQGT